MIALLAAISAAWIWLAIVLILVGTLAFIFGALVGRATGWQEGYEAGSNRPPGEDVPADVTPFVRDQASFRRNEQKLRDAFPPRP